MKKRLSLIVALTLVLISLFTLGFSNNKVNATTLSDQEKVDQEVANINVPKKAIIDFPVVSESAYGSTIEWESSDPSILNVPQNGGWVVVTRPQDSDVTVTLTVTITLNNAQASNEFYVSVPKGETQTNTYQISYALNGGTQNIENPTSYVVGTTPEVKAPTKGTVAFLGWYDNEEFDGSPITVLPKGLSGDYKLYAKWDVAVVERIEIVSNPAQLVYNALDNFDPTGLEVKAYYNDTTDKMLTAAEIDAMNLDEIKLHADVEEVLVSYQGQTASIAITVNKINFDMSGVSFVSTSKKYDGTAQSLEISGDLPQGLVVSYTGSATNVKDGAQTITATFGFDPNYTEYERDYNLPVAMTTTLTITKAAMTITADNKTMPIGGNLPEFTVTVSGAKNQADENLARSLVIIKCDANSSSPAATYPITIEEFEMDNYVVTTVGGTLTVNEGSYTVEAITSTFEFTGSKHEFKAVFKDGGVEKNVELTYSIDGAIKVGKYEVTVSWNDNTYGEGSETVIYNITPVELQADMFDDLSKFSHTGYEIKPKVTGKFGEYTLTEGVDYTLDYEDNIAKGTAKVIIIPVAKGNFDLGQSYVVEKSFVIWESELERVTTAKTELVNAHSSLNGQLEKLETLTVYNANWETDIYWMSTSTALSVDAEGKVSVILTDQEQTVELYAIIMAGNAAEYAMFTVVIPAYTTTSDNTTDVSVEGVQPGAQVEVVETDGTEAGFVVGENQEVIVGYEITLKQNGETVQPMSKVTVKLPVPSGYNENTLSVYYVAEGKEPENMNAELVEGYLVFETTHFSKYIVVGEEEKQSEPEQGESKKIVFEFGEDDSSKTDETKQDGNDYNGTEFTSNGYTLVLTSCSKVYSGSYDAKGNACLKLGTGSAAGSFTFTVPNDVTSVIIKVSGYKAKTVGITVNGASQTISTLSSNGEYTDVIVDTTSNKTVTFTTTTNYRCKITSITFVTGSGSVTPDPEPSHEHVACPICQLCTAADCDGTAEEKCTGHTVVGEYAHTFDFGTTGASGYSANKTIELIDGITNNKYTVINHWTQTSTSANSPHANNGAFAVLCPVRKNNSTKDSYIQFDFTSAVSSITFDATWWSSDDVENSSKIVKFEVQYSTDGTNWTTVDFGGTAALSASEYKTFTCAVEGATHVRIYCEGDNTYTSNQSARLVVDNIKFKANNN